MAFNSLYHWYSTLYTSGIQPSILVVFNPLYYCYSTLYTSGTQPSIRVVLNRFCSRTPQFEP
jgi:hypothetical protein